MFGLKKSTILWNLIPIIIQLTVLYHSTFSFAVIQVILTIISLISVIIIAEDSFDFSRLPLFLWLTPITGFFGLLFIIVPYVSKKIKKFNTWLDEPRKEKPKKLKFKEFTKKENTKYEY